MRNASRIVPLLLVLAACTPPAPPAPPVPAQPEPPATVEAPPAAAPSTIGSSAVESRPSPGSFGFNWLDPESSTCRSLTDEDLAAFKKCASSKNAFGLDIDSVACTVDAKVEYIVYKDAAQCQQAFEAMQANGD
jgi:hypothetical protein